ncbi:MAG: Oxidoreductase NAD-binding domain/FAD binding domain/putative Fe-S cluster [Phycisphaerales bacterium]|nr:Oxidoreductase NAD-binding domain/FAD binding domain/putative Fe-S cluster [Phycisphaerales bacterium]
MMMVPTLPETAPFSPAQRAWLNGFFAGLVSSTGSAPSGGETVAVATPTMTEEESFPWHDAALPISKRLELAKDKPVERQMMAAMAQLDCGACGYVCQTYSEAIARGEEKNLTLCTPGGKETASKLKELIQLRIKPTPGQSEESAATAAPSRIPPAQSTHSRKNPYPARLIASNPLNKPGSDKDTRHVVLDLKGSTLSYKPGDALGVWPENCPDLVQEILELLHASGAEDVPAPDGQHTSLREALLRDYIITQPTEDLFKLFGQPEAENVAVIDLLRQHARKLTDLAKFVAALSPLQPRLYSISSSLLAHPNQVHLTVGVVRYNSIHGTPCKGIASTYLSQGLRPGQKARVFVHASAKFALPASGDTPMIMVGPGTGIAPFRAFLAERGAAGHKGKNWLFFGDQRQAADFLYEDEIQSFQSSGVLTNLSTAFSRDQEKKVYVQHRMLEQGKELFEWLEQGAHFYVCGDAKRMASDVDNALKQIVAEQGGMSAEEATAYVAKLTKTNRYQRDVY